MKYKPTIADYSTLFTSFILPAVNDDSIQLTKTGKLTGKSLGHLLGTLGLPVQGNIRDCLVAIYGETELIDQAAQYARHRRELAAGKKGAPAQLITSIQMGENWEYGYDHHDHLPACYAAATKPEQPVPVEPVPVEPVPVEPVPVEPVPVEPVPVEPIISQQSTKSKAPKTTKRPAEDVLRGVPVLLSYEDHEAAFRAPLTAAEMAAADEWDNLPTYVSGWHVDMIDDDSEE